MEFHSVERMTCKVHIALDEHNAQEYAMLAAMFSRSNEGALALVDRVQREGASGRFLDTYLVKYGHASIGDLVDVKLFVEGIPFYMAALIEHHARFRGQESSTRFVIFDKQPPCFDADPTIHQKYIATYLKAVEKVKNNILERHSRQDGIEIVTHKRAINARAFDICRSLLPLSCTTNVAWYGDIRTMKAHCAWMEANYEWSKPYVAVIKQALSDVYPESVGDWSRVRGHNGNNPWTADKYDFSSAIDPEIDFGSWRDLNRHRVGYQEFMIPRKPMHHWYKQMLEAHEVAYIDGDTKNLNTTLLGNCGHAYYEMPEMQTEYFIKLRSKPSVHPTLREAVHVFAIDENKENFRDQTEDPGPFGYFVARGNDTILVKGEE